jgi:hypothetical protein
MTNPLWPETLQLRAVVERSMTMPVLPVNSAQKVCAILRVLSADGPMRLTAVASPGAGR